MSVTIISVGGGGYNLASDIISANIFPDSRLIVCDTVQADLDAHAQNADKTFLLKNVKKKWLKSSDLNLVDQIAADFSDTNIICATLGGMTGSRYAPLIALAARLSGKFVCTVATYPFGFEGKAKARRAIDVFVQIMISSNLTFWQDNNRLTEIEDQLPALEFNKPLVETMSSVLKGHSLEELAHLSSNHNKNIELVPPYRIEGFPLVSVRGDGYPDSRVNRQNVFDFLE